LPKDRISVKDAAAVDALLEECFKDIPKASGLNNHRSYKATLNRPLMAWFMKRFKGLGLYYLDSGVSSKTVAFEEARAAGIPALRNDYFLEPPPKPSEAVCRKVLGMAAKLARKKGRAVVIGHHYHRSTLDCLKSEVPKLQAQGFEFVPASKLAR